MATTENQVIERKSMERGAGPMAAGAVLPEGTLCFFSATGFVEAGIGASGVNNLAGLTIKRFDNTGGANGALQAEFYREMTVLLTGAGFTQADIGKKVYASDNNTVTKTSTNHVEIGIIAEFVSATQVWVRLRALAK